METGTSSGSRALSQDGGSTEAADRERAAVLDRQGSSSSKGSVQPTHERDLSNSSTASDPPSSATSADAYRKMQKSKSSSSKASIVLVTLDGEQLNAVEVGGVQSGAAVRERMLTRVHVHDDEMSACTIHYGPVGEPDEMGEALDNEELLEMCRNPAKLPNFHAFMVRNPLQAESSHVSKMPQPTPPAPVAGPSKRSPQLSDALMANYMLSNQPEEASEDEQEPKRRGSKSRSSKLRSSDPVPFNGRMRSDSDPYASERRQTTGRLSSDWPGPSTSMHESYSAHGDPSRSAQDERYRYERLQERRPSSSGSAGGMRLLPQQGRGPPVYPQSPAQMTPPVQFPVGHLPPPPMAQHQRLPPGSSGGPRQLPPGAYFPGIGPRVPSAPQPPRHPSYPGPPVGPHGRPILPAHSVDDMRQQYRTTPSGVHEPAGLSRTPRVNAELRGPRLDPRTAPPSFAEGRHTIGPRSMTPVSAPRSAPMPNVAQFPSQPGTQPYMRSPSYPSSQYPPEKDPRMDPRRIPQPLPPMTAPPYTTSYAHATVPAPTGRGPQMMGRAGPSATLPPPISGPSMRPPPEQLSMAYQGSRPPSAVRSPVSASTPVFDARQKLPLQPGEVLQDALSGGTLVKRAQQTLPRIETNHASPIDGRGPPPDGRASATARRPSPIGEPSSARSSRRPSATERESELSPLPPRSPSQGHTPTSSSSSTNSERLARSDIPDALVPGRASKRTDEGTSSPRRSEDESSINTVSSGRPSSRSSQTSVDSPLAPPPPACPAAPSAPALWEDDVDGPEDTGTWVAPGKKHRKTLSADDGSGTARQKDWLNLDLGTAAGSLGIDASTLRGSKGAASTSAEMPADDEFADDFDDDIEASTWAGPRRSSEGGSSKTLRPNLTVNTGSETSLSSTDSTASQRTLGKKTSVSSASTLASASTPASSIQSEGLSRTNARKTARQTGASPVQRKPTMRGDVRPSAEQVYDNLDVFFPNHDLDKPILVEVDTSSADSPSSPSAKNASAAASSQSVTREMKMARHKSIRIVANDRAKQLEQAKAAEKAGDKADAPSASKHHSSLSAGFGAAAKALLRRKSTKLWGRKIEEVTPAQENANKAISVAPVSDQTGEESFKWLKGDLIGKGSYGKVYLGFNMTNGEMLAVKQVELPKTAGDREDDRQTGSINALKFEIETLKDLNHPNIVEYLGFEQTPDYLSIFLEYVPGGSVGRWVRKFGKFEESVVKFFTIQILDGLSYLHANGILHRDLKADNVLVDNEGMIRISDFGISKRSANVYEANEFMSMQGSIFWMAPEVVHNAKKGYSAKVDIWSLGCVVLEMFAGRRPWDTEMAIAAMFKIGAERLAPPVPDDVKLSPPAAAFLERCFIVDATRRPTAESLMEDRLMLRARDIDFPTTALGRAILRTQSATSTHS